MMWRIFTFLQSQIFLVLRYGWVRNNNKHVENRFISSWLNPNRSLEIMSEQNLF